MRFNVNQVVLLVGFKLLGVDGKRIDRGITFRVPQTDQTIEEIQIIEATVKEHHKVPDEWSDEKKYNGFIFDIAGVKGLNQYPRASYGQISDTQDRIISTQRHVYESVYKEDYDQYSKGTEIVHYTTAENILETIDDGIEYMQKNKMPEREAVLHEHKRLVMEAIEKAYPNKYEVQREEIIEGSGVLHTVLKEKVLAS